MAMSLFYNLYLRPFQAAVRSGAQTAMAAFNDLNGVPCTVNKFLLREVLKDTLGLPGFVVSDANAIKECVSHGIASDDDTVRQLPGHDRPVPGVLQGVIRRSRPWSRGRSFSAARTAKARRTQTPSFSAWATGRKRACMRPARISCPRRLIGDANNVSNIMYAIWDAYEVASTL